MAAAEREQQGPRTHGGSQDVPTGSDNLEAPDNALTHAQAQVSGHP